MLHMACLRRIRCRSKGQFAHGTLAITLLIIPFIAAPVFGQASTPTANVVVRVSEAGREQPIDQAKVELTRFPEGVVQMAFTDGSGRLEFLGLFPQSYILRISKPGFRATEVSVDVRRGETAKSVNAQLQREEGDAPALTAGMVSARDLSIPKPALTATQKGVQALNEKKDAQQAVRFFQEAVKLFPEYYEAYFMLGAAQMQLKAYDEAQKAYEKAIEVNPQFVRPYYPLAVLLASRKRHEDAERLLLRAVEMDAQNWEGPFELARSYANRQLWEKALHYGELAHSRPNPATKVHLLMADLYSNTGQTDKAIMELEKFIRLDPNSSFLPKAKAALEQLRKQK
jgi:tetratricopeptide (TPR) repeat protein